MTKDDFVQQATIAIYASLVSAYYNHHAFVITDPSSEAKLAANALLQANKLHAAITGSSSSS